MIEFINDHLKSVLIDAKTISQVAPVSLESVGIITTVVNAVNALPYHATKLGSYDLKDFLVPQVVGSALIQPASVTVSGDPDVGIDFHVVHNLGIATQPKVTVSYTPDDFSKAWVDFCRPLRTQNKVRANLAPVTDFRKHKELSSYFPKADGIHELALLNHVKTSKRHTELSALVCLTQDFHTTEASFFGGYSVSDLMPFWYQYLIEALAAL